MKIIVSVATKVAILFTVLAFLGCSTVDQFGGPEPGHGCAHIHVEQNPIVESKNNFDEEAYYADGVRVVVGIVR